jgi:hypothetical protein
MSTKSTAIPSDVAETVARSGLGWMRSYPEPEYQLRLTGDQLAELERLLAWYTECLAQHNLLSPGAQCTLDTLNGAWPKLANALPTKEDQYFKTLPPID